MQDFTKCTVESYMQQLENKCGDSREVRMKRKIHIKALILKFRDSEFSLFKGARTFYVHHIFKFPLLLTFALGF